MSTPEAQALLKKVIEDTINEYTRGKLDTSVHVIDISYNSLLASNVVPDNRRYRANYTEFLNEAKADAIEVSDYAQALQIVKTNKGTCILYDSGSTLLISKNFDAARRFITAISNKIPSNDDFGMSFRSRNLQEIESTRSLYRASGSQFLRLGPDGKYSVYKVLKLPNTNKYGLVPVEGFQDIKEINYFAQRRSTNYTITSVLAKFNNMEVEVNTDNTVTIKRDVLSVLDLGHGQGSLASQATPLGMKISNVLSLDISNKGRALVNEYMKELIDLHSVVSYEFKNTSDDTKAGGYVVLSIQKYTRNNSLSISEGAILAKLRKNIDLLTIPGSNTIAQDVVEITKNKLISALTGKPAKTITKHKTVTGKAKPKITTSKPSTTKVSATRKTETLTASANKIQTTVGPGVNLTSLQSLINQHLQNVISANMGSGTEKRILNYRTGRFAASAKVETMSQSRQGMITAFYSYMKNPYQTFEPGFKQGSPKTRDPKLLISQSIREIAATRVGNQLRAQAL